VTLTSEEIARLRAELGITVTKQRKRREPREIRHGTTQGFHAGCRCPDCRSARNQRRQELREQRRSTRELVDGRLVATQARVHGSSTYREWGCRCRVCTDAVAREFRVYYQRRRAS